MNGVVFLYRIEHLGLNVVLQLLVGVPLEMVHGATRIGLVYVAGVVAGRQVGRKSVGVNSPRVAGRPHGTGQAPGFQRSTTPSPRLLTTRVSKSPLERRDCHPEKEACDGKGRRPQDPERAD